MPISREDFAHGLVTAGLLGAGVLVGHEVMAGVVLTHMGSEWLSALLERAFGKITERSHGPLNHDLQHAVERAYSEALAHLEQTWWQTPDGLRLRRNDRSLAREIERVFKDVRKDIHEFFARAQGQRAMESAGLSQLLRGEPENLGNAMSQYIAQYFDIYLHGRSPELISFLGAHFVTDLALFLGEELKADTPEGTRAWRAYQRLVFDGLQGELSEVRVSQKEMGQSLAQIKAWIARIEALPEQARDTTTDAALTAGVAKLQSDLTDSFAREFDITRHEINSGINQVSRLLRDEMQRLRLQLGPQLQQYGLSETVRPLRADLRDQFETLLNPRDSSAFYGVFAGRSSELAIVREFMAAPVGGYLIITGPPGFGKSALMLELARRENAIYQFTRRALGTADEDFFLRNLCQQLAVRHGLGGELPSATAELRVLYPKLLRLPPNDGLPVIVLLDGLDEALNWQPGPAYFPRDLPDGVKVIAATRTVAAVDWTAKLGLQDTRLRLLELGVLSSDDVVALLRTAGEAIAGHTGDARWVASIRKISGGDPFYIKLLADDLRAGRITADAVEQQPSGLESYLRSWWDQAASVLPEQEVRDLMGTLAVARGPIRRQELIAMFPPLGWGLDAGLDHARRFVLGNDDEGYALCHPRFAAYVRQRVGAGLQTYVEALISYCSKWREHRSAYALTFYPNHLTEAGRWTDLDRLVAHADGGLSYADARYALQGSYEGYLAALDLAWTHTEQTWATDPASSGRAMRYALFRASINSMVANVPVEALVSLVHEGLWPVDIAASHAIRVPDGATRCDVLQSLSVEARQQGSERLSHDLLENALAIARVLEPLPERMKRLVAIASHMPDAERKSLIAEAFDMLPTMPTVHDALAGVKLLMPYLASDQRPRAVAFVGRLEEPLIRAEGIVALAACVPPEMLRDEIAKFIAHASAEAFPWQRAQCLARIAPAVPASERHQVLEAALAAAAATNSIPGGAVLATQPMIATLRNLPTDRGHEVAVQVLQLISRFCEMKNPNDRMETMRSARIEELGPLLPADLAPVAFRLAAELGNPFQRTRAFAALAATLPQESIAEAWSELLRAFREAPRFREALLAFAPRLAAYQMDQALACVRSLIEPYDRAKGFAALVPAIDSHARTNVCNEALTAAQMIPNDFQRRNCILEIAPLLTAERRREVLQDLLAMSRTIGDFDARAEALAALTVRLPENERGKAMSDALTGLSKISRLEYQLRARIELAGHLSPPERNTLIIEMLNLARTTDQEYLQAPQMAALLPFFDGAARSQLATETLQALRGRKYQVMTGKTMNLLAPYIPEALFGDVVALVGQLHGEDRAEAIEAIAPRLNDPFLAPMLKSAVDIANSTVRGWPFAARAISAILARARTDIRDQMIAAVLQDLKSREKHLERAEAIAILVPQLAPADIESILLAVESEHFPLFQESTLIALARHVTPDLVPRFHSVAQGIADAQPRAKALAALLPLDRTMLAEAATAAFEIEEWSSPAARPLVAVAKIWAEAPSSDASELWRFLARRGGLRRRDDLLSALRVLTPVLARLGGTQACAELFQAVEDVGQWRP